jgi:hypothetical protein
MKDKVDGKINQIEQSIRQPISFQGLEDVIHKWLLMADVGLIRIVAATVIANKLRADPVWVFIVAAPGGTKTELIRALGKVPGIYPISDLTPQTFLSGQKGTKGSLLHRLDPETILTYKDFTTVLTMHRDKRHAILSQLREIYDGSFSKEFGTGETKNWEGKMGFIAGVTSIIDNHQSVFQVLGERFIQYRPKQPDPILLARKAISNNNSGKEMREEIQQAFADFISSIKIPETLPEMSEDMQDRIAHLAAFCVRGRSGVVREGYSREIDLIPDSELPTRLAKQFITLVAALDLIDNTDQERNYNLIYKIGMDSLPQKRRKILTILGFTEGLLETAEVATTIGYPTNTTRKILEDLHGLGLIDRDHQGQGYSDRWSINTETKRLMARITPGVPEMSVISPDESGKVEGKQSLPGGGV